ncbi:MAG TPA: hypothetical protein VNE38_02675 [Ktedonobacteraceae bacterium]|nr:hypothetical protein [Ktedonobacteraceae bacterium]
MNSSALQYVGFVVAALILTWAVIEVNRRYFRRRRVDVKPLSTWVHLNTGQPEAAGESLPGGEGEEEASEASERDLQSRARQNGHYSGSKKTL